MIGDNWEEDEDDFVEEPAEVDLVPCPACGAEIYEDAEQCPKCGQYIVPDTRAWSGKPLWWMLLGLVGIAAVIYTLVRTLN
jgi:hypothetical protein